MSALVGHRLHGLVHKAPFLLPQLRQTKLSARCLCTKASKPVLSSSSIDASGIRPCDEPDGQMKLDAILVLGGGLKECGAIPTWVERRLDLAQSLYKQQADASQPPWILLVGAGTPHKPPPLDKHGFVVHEATRCSEYLLQKGVPASHLVKEMSSYDTIGNAWFSLTAHVLPAQWTSLAVITNDFHMPRSRAIFEQMWLRVYMTPGLGQQQPRSVLHFGSASDDGLIDGERGAEVLEARCAKEHAAKERWMKDVQGLYSLKDVWHWLNTTHRCYAVSRQGEVSVASTPQEARVLASY